MRVHLRGATRDIYRPDCVLFDNIEALRENFTRHHFGPACITLDMAVLAVHVAAFADVDLQDVDALTA